MENPNAIIYLGQLEKLLRDVLITVFVSLLLVGVNTTKVWADVQTQLDISKANIIIGDGTVIGKTTSGFEATTNSNGYIIVGSGVTTSNTIVINGGVHSITLKDVDISTTSSAAISIENSNTKVTLILDGKINKLTSISGKIAPLSILENAELTIDTGDGSNNAMLIVKDVEGAVAIGGNEGTLSGKITINHGYISAYSSGNGAAIGGNIIINGGIVYAEAHGLGAAIGGGNGGEGGNITINNGIVYADAYGTGAAIGGGNAGAGGNITINDGVIYAEAYGMAAAIGGGASSTGYNNKATNLIINGGTITTKIANKAICDSMGYGSVDSSYVERVRKDTKLQINGGNIISTNFSNVALIPLKDNTQPVNISGTNVYLTTIVAEDIPSETSVTVLYSGKTLGSSIYGKKVYLYLPVGNQWVVVKVNSTQENYYGEITTISHGSTGKVSAGVGNILNIDMLGGGSVSLNEKANISCKYINQFVMGTTIKLTGTAKEGYAFAYWKDVNSGSIISENPIYNFIIGSGTDIEAVFNPILTQTNKKVTVTFKDKSGKILGEEKIEKGSIAIPPSTPNLFGYTFIKWDKELDNITSDLIVTALYERENVTYNVTVSGGILSTGGTTGKFKFDMPVTVVASEASSEGKFICWQQDGKNVSTKATFTFFAPNKVTSMSAIYLSNGTGVEEEPFITLSENVVVDNINKTMMFTASRNVLDEYTLIESGVIMIKSSTPLRTPITVDTENAILGKIKDDSTDQFYIRKSSIKDGDTWYARGYLIYKDKDGKVYKVYSFETISKRMGG